MAVTNKLAFPETEDLFEGMYFNIYRMEWKDLGFTRLSNDRCVAQTMSLACCCDHLKSLRSSRPLQTSERWSQAGCLRSVEKLRRRLCAQSSHCADASRAL